ncbi:protein IWS1 homolog [Lates calcarifer]|uniref:OTU deubiquitinase with linear linkage specificity a n=1 Tax=Lates calcarifer TaxID=8187 RepID=A0A4W6CQ67_LATCA|nr:protein IWS1 homolog [Lates calcarifer]
MGNCCCWHTESPCGSVEETSGLLTAEAKATVPTGETVVEGTCGPDGDDEVRKTPNEPNIKVEEKTESVLVKQSPENGETEPNNTQENGPLKKESIQTATPSPCKGFELKENSTRAQDETMKEPPDNSGQAEPQQCTLNWEVFPETKYVALEEENPASVQEKIPDGISQTAESVHAEKPSHTETTTTTEHITASVSHDDEEEAGSEVTVDNAVVEPSGEFSQNNEVLPVPNTPPPASVVSQEISKEAQSCAVTEDSDNGRCSVCKHASPEVTKSHDVSESSPGPEPTGLNHSGEEQDSANSVRESETTAPADASASSKSDQNEKPDSESSAISLKEVASSGNVKQDTGEETMLRVQDKDGDVSKGKEEDMMKDEAENTPSETEPQAGKDAEVQEVTGKEEQVAESTAANVKVEVEKEDSAEDDLENSDEDLYRGAEELSASQNNKAGSLSAFEATLLKVEDRCSLAPAVDILSYSEREWKGNTAKSALIRKGYKEMSQRFGSLRRVRGDNYCALRATLFQVLSHSTQLPAWLQEDDITTLPKQLEAQEGLISQWTFPGECLQGDGTGDVTQQLKGYMELLRNKWQAAVDCSSAVERQQLCEQAFQGGEEELGLLEALKLLMLGRAVELHGCMQGGGDVPLFCWLLFARDSSDCPRSFLSNHLSHVGLSAGLEQVEMFLLGYALQCTIQVYRLYKADTEEFVTYYPDDHKDDWPLVCLITEDDRHYNVPVVEAAELHRDTLQLHSS